MDPDLHARARDQVGERDQVIFVGMHAAGRGEAHQVAGAAVALQLGDQLLEVRDPGERAVGDGGVDARHVGDGHAAGAEVHVAHFGVAHLALGQADEAFRGVDQPLRAGRDQPVVVRRAGIEDRIVPGIGAVAPPIEDAEQGGTRTGNGHHEALRRIWRIRSTELNLLGQFSSRGSVLGFWSGTSMAQNTNSPRGSPSIEMS